METLISILNILLPVLYFGSTFLYGKSFFKERPWAERYQTGLLSFAVFLHIIEVLLRGIYFHHFPLATIAEAASVLALAIAVIYLYVEFRLQVPTTGYFILIFVFFLQLFSSVTISHVDKIPEILHSSFFIFHTSAAIIGYSALAVSAIYGLMYLLLFYDIKSSRFSIIYGRLPSLEILNEMNFKAASLGFAFLTVAILLGGIWSYRIYQQTVHFDAKILIAVLTWLIYAIEIYGRKIRGWAGRRLAYLSLSGFVIIIFSLVAVNLFLTSFHEFK